jgi:membrane protease YdiL (CAAX protease family)
LILFTGPKEDLKSLIDTNYWYRVISQTVQVASALFTTWAIVVNSEKLSLKNFGLTVRVKECLMGLVIGGSFMLSFSLISYVFGTIHFSFNKFSIDILGSLFVYFLVAVGEEVIVRGYPLFKLQSKVGNFWALFITSFVFGLMHLGNDHFTWLGYLNISLSGLLMGIITLRTRSLSSAIGIHWAWNYVQGTIFGFAVSGHNITGILKAEQLSTPMLTGGDFGAEGSALLIPITLFLILLVNKYLNPQEA